MNKKTKTLVLMTILFSTGMFWHQACTNTDETRKKQPQKPLTEKPNVTQEKKADAYNYAYNYILDINGYHSYINELNALRPSWNDSADIEEIKLEYTLGGTMTKRVTSEGIKIIDKSYAKIVSLLDNYNIHLGDRIVSNNDEFAIIQNPDDQNTNIIYCYKPNMAFIGICCDQYDDNHKNFWGLNETEGAFNTISSVIYEIIDESRVSEKIKQNIKAQVQNIINKTKHDLQVNRHNIEREYKDYYLLDEYYKKSLGIGNHVFGYRDLDIEDINGKFAITRQYTSVYAPNLNKDFFSDTSAQYKLVNMGRNQWCVEKRMLNGSQTRTDIFNGVATISKHTDISPVQIKNDDTNFEFEPDTTGGGRVFFDKVIAIKKRNKDWVVQIPQKAQRTIDSLNREIARKTEIEKIADKKAHEADSIAKIIIKNKFETNER